MLRDGIFVPLSEPSGITGQSVSVVTGGSRSSLKTRMPSSSIIRTITRSLYAQPAPSRTGSSRVSREHARFQRSNPSPHNARYFVAFAQRQSRHLGEHGAPSG